MMQEATKTDEEATISQRHFVESVAYLLRETFVGSPGGDASAYLDRGVGVFPTLAAISAAAASMNHDGTTIAAQTEHAKFYLDRMCEFMNGRTEPVNWEQSWLIETVSDGEWTILRDGCRKSYEGVLRCIAGTQDW
ncbi:MAG: hypothetical protein PSX80_04250, partial [bacterium]|nr:hypothetical protein [bacterium]